MCAGPNLQINPILYKKTYCYKNVDIILFPNRIYYKIWCMAFNVTSVIGFLCRLNWQWMNYILSNILDQNWNSNFYFFNSMFFAFSWLTPFCSFKVQKKKKLSIVCKISVLTNSDAKTKISFTPAELCPYTYFQNKIMLMIYNNKFKSTKHERFYIAHTADNFYVFYK